MPIDTALSVYTVVAVAVTISLVVALHYLEPEFESSWRMLSEYSLGKYGILMRLAFIVGSSAVAVTGVVLWSSIGWAASGLIFVAIGPLGAAFVDTDPITTPLDQKTRRNAIHQALGSLFILGFPIAATIAGIFAGPLLGWASILPWAGLVWFMTATLRNAQPGVVGSPEVRIGWPNRFNMLAYLAWVVLVVLVA
jgi:hypothetical protein